MNIPEKSLKGKIVENMKVSFQKKKKGQTSKHHFTKELLRTNGYSYFHRGETHGHHLNQIKLESPTTGQMDIACPLV